MYCTKCGAQIPDGSTFCTSCGARVGGVEDQAEPVAFPVGDAPATAPQGAPAHMAAQPRYEESVTEPAEASQPSVPTPQPKKPSTRAVSSLPLSAVLPLSPLSPLS
ncbi:MAG: zinc-ribbon domain-containing protein [Collinsella sp.]